jgi:ferredoxin-NADP reductase
MNSRMVFSNIQVQEFIQHNTLALLLTTSCIGALLAWALLFRRPRAPALLRDWQSFRVSGRMVANPESDRIVIFLTLNVSTLDLPTGSHVKLRMYKEDGKEIVRSYTPTRFNRGECEIMFRVYPQGIMTPLLEKLRVGDTVEMMGPTGLERYATEGSGTFTRGSGKIWRGIKYVGMISGGTGITPMLQIANHVLQDSADNTKLSLLSFTNTVADIMLGDTLRSLAKNSRGALKLKFITSHGSNHELSLHSDVELGSMRSMSINDLERLLNVPTGAETMICICGPDGFVTAAQEKLKERYENILVW